MLLLEEAGLICRRGCRIPPARNFDKYSEQFVPKELEVRILCDIPWNAPRMEEIQCDQIIKILPLLFESTTCMESVSLLPYEINRLKWLKLFFILADYRPWDYYTFPRDDAILKLYRKFAQNYPFETIARLCRNNVVPPWLAYEILVDYGSDKVLHNYPGIWDRTFAINHECGEYLEKTLLLLKPKERAWLISIYIHDLESGMALPTEYMVCRVEDTKKYLLQINNHEIFNTEMLSFIRKIEYTSRGYENFVPDNNTIQSTRELFAWFGKKHLVDEYFNQVETKLSLPENLSIWSEIDHETKCMICLGRLKDRGTVVLLPCNHILHRSCTSIWLGIRKSCPVCRAHMASFYYKINGIPFNVGVEEFIEQVKNEPVANESDEEME